MVTLNMWIWSGAAIAKQLIKYEVDIFNKKFPDITIQITVIPWRDAWDSIINAANEQKGPDILQVGSTWNATLANLGVLKDITEEFNKTMVSKDLFMPAAMSSCNFPASERMSSLPWFADIRTIYYRRDIFRTLGMSGDNLYDWNSFEQTCKTIKGFKKGEKIIEVLGVSGQKDALLLHNISPWIWAAGGDFLTPDTKKSAFNSRETLNGIEFYISLITKGYISLDALKLTTENINEGFFIRGDYAVAVPGPISEYSPFDPNRPGYNKDVAINCVPSLFPNGPAGRFVFCGGSNLAIASFSEHSQEAWEFIKFLTSYESQNRYSRSINMFPALLESFDSVFIEEESPEQQGLRNSWKYGRAFPNVPAWGAIESLLIESFGKMFARVREGDYDISKVRTDLDKTALDVDSLLAR
jgi:multiple sugar transport system substrate-binding protein